MQVQRKPLSVLTAETLRTNIASGTWAGILPSELKLSAELGVSRTTLRMALGILRRQRILTIGPGNRPTVVETSQPAKRPKSMHAVNVLLPFSFRELPNFALFWINELRAQLHSSGRAMHLISSRAFYREKKGKVREKLVQENPADCWILAFSNAEAQRWFQDRGIPAIIGGLPHDGIKLPCVSVDGHAIMFHMLGNLTAHGHRRIALVTDNASSMTPLVFLRVFHDICRKLGPDKVEPEAITVREDAPDSVGREILQSIRRRNGPTALIIYNPLNVVAAFSYLPANGVIIPRDVSVVTTFGDGYLDHVSPPPARYLFDAVSYARRLISIIQKLEMGMNASGFRSKLMLEPIEGKSVGPPRQAPLSAGGA